MKRAKKEGESRKKRRSKVVKGKKRKRVSQRWKGRVWNRKERERKRER